MPPFIEVRNLTKRFGDHVVLDRLSIDIQEGEIIIFQGPSGIGKSTFLRCLTYLEPFQNGSVRVGNVEVHAGMNEERDHKTILALRQQMGYVFQFFNLFPHLTVLQNLTLGPIKVLSKPVDQAREEAFKLLKRVGLEEKAGNCPAALSGGQQQRVAIVRALAMQPRAILFDEPTSSLDPEMKKEIIHVIEEFRKDRPPHGPADDPPGSVAGRLTMLIVTHEPDFVKRIASRVITFAQHGRIS